MREVPDLDDVNQEAVAVAKRARVLLQNRHHQLRATKSPFSGPSFVPHAAEFRRAPVQIEVLKQAI